MDYEQKEDSHKVLAGTTYCRLHKPTIKLEGLYKVDKQDYVLDE